MTRAVASVASMVVFLLAAVSSACMAQEALTTAALARGMKVRLEWSPPDSVMRTGMVGRNPDADGFLFRPSNRDAARRVTFAGLQSLEVRTSRDSRWGEGMLLGMAVGAILPYLLPEPEGDLELRPLGAIILGSLGALVGSGVGYTIARETWAPVMLR